MAQSDDLKGLMMRISTWDMKRGLASMVVIVLSIAVATLWLPSVARAGGDHPLLPEYSFETDLQDWIISTAMDSSSTTITRVSEHNTDGDFAALLEFDHGADHTKAIYEIVSEFGWDLSDQEFLEFDLWKNGQPPQVAVALSIGVDLIWHESFPVALEDGTNSMKIDLTSSNWKTEASSWEYSVPVTELDQVYRIHILLLPSDIGPGEAYLDNLRFSSTDTAEAIEPAPTDVTAEQVNATLPSLTDTPSSDARLPGQSDQEVPISEEDTVSSPYLVLIIALLVGVGIIVIIAVVWFILRSRRR